MIMTSVATVPNKPITFPKQNTSYRVQRRARVSHGGGWRRIFRRTVYLTVLDLRSPVGFVFEFPRYVASATIILFVPERGDGDPTALTPRLQRYTEEFIAT